MSFTSLQFPFFLALVLAGLALLKPGIRWVWLVAASCWFYMAFIPAYILILFLLIGIDYTAGLFIEASHGKKRAWWLWTSLAANVGLLASFKYLNFILENSSHLLSHLGADAIAWRFPWALPIGLSFHTFQSMAYTIEVYYGRQKAERHLGIYALYVLYFPQMVAGPIERPQNLLESFHRPVVMDWNKLAAGFRQIAWGFFKKVVVADRLADTVNAAYAANSKADGGTLLLATWFFAFQIYCDFSGYTDIARGLARCMGYELMLNFNRPYASRSPGEFWRRWHISLSSWFRDYLYIPLGGSRKGTFRTCLNYLIVFSVSGLWHGAAWSFIVWGALHGGYLVVYRLLGLERADSDIPWKKLLQVFVTFQLVSFAWVFFRATSLTHALDVVRTIANPSLPGQLLSALSGTEVRFGIALLAVLESVQFLQSRGAGRWLQARPVWVRWSAWYALVAVIIIFGKFGNEQFIYFQF